MRTCPIGVAIATLALAACSGSSGDTDATDPAPPNEPESVDVGDPTADPSESGSTLADPVQLGPAIIDGVANGLVLVHDVDGGDRALLSYQADGTEVANYSGDPNELIVQPIWSPDGRRVASVRSVDGAVWQLVTSAVDGTGTTVHELPGRPDYITYDPTASRVLALTPSSAGFGLVIVEVDGEAATDRGADPFEIVDLGIPYFSDFSPEGGRVISHVSTDLRIVDLSGEITSLGLSAAAHQTPAWHPTDDTLFFTADTGDGERLVSFQLSDQSVTELAEIVSFAAFDLDPTGTRLAVMAYGITRAGGGLEAFRGGGTAPSGSSAATVLETGLWVVDVADGTARLLTSEPHAAPLWDPTGTRLLVRTSLSGTGRWNVFDLEGTRIGTDEFDVNGSMAPAYLPFWDQFVRSQTVWSPDGEQFVHVGRSTADDRSGVWIHDAATSGASVLLAAGDLAFWSPT